MTQLSIHSDILGKCLLIYVEYLVIAEFLCESHFDYVSPQVKILVRELCKAHGFLEPPELDRMESPSSAIFLSPPQSEDPPSDNGDIDKSVEVQGDDDDEDLDDDMEMHFEMEDDAADTGPGESKDEGERSV